MNGEQQLQRIYNEFAEFRKEQVAQGKVLARVETNLKNHIDGSKPYRDKVDAHDKSIQRLRGAWWAISLIGSSVLGWIEYKLHGGK